MKRYGPGAIANGKCATWSFTSSSTGPRARSRGFRVSRSIRATASAAEAVIAALRRAATVLALSALSAGCAGFSAISPGDSAHSVEARVGPPAAVWKNADGSEIWEYPQGFYAVQTFMVDIGPDQAVSNVHQVLNEAYFSRIQPGMSREDVRRLIGRPREIWYFPARDEETWTWRYYDINYRFFNVLFDRTAGTVRTTLRLDEVFPPGRGR